MKKDKRACRQKISSKEYYPNKKTFEKIKVIEDAYKIEGRLTLRRVYYILLSKKMINHSKGSYNSLSKLLTLLREKGFLDPDIIEDRHRTLIKRNTFEDFDQAFNLICEIYKKNSSIIQEKYVEVWIEKDTMQHIFYDDCYNSDVPLIISKGFTSYTFKNEAVNRFQKQNKPIAILYFGDFDCEGEYIPKILKTYFEKRLPDVDIEFKKILLTKTDIDNLNLPSVVDEGLNKKEQLQKAYVQDFIKQNGKVKYEVEAMSFDEVKKKFQDALYNEIDLQVVENNDLESKREVERWIKQNLKGGKR